MSDSLNIPESSARQMTLNYLRTPGVDSFWQWQDHGTVITGPSGETIAFLEEIIPVLQWLAPRGLPRFGSMVLLLAACRTAWFSGNISSRNQSFSSHADHVFGPLYPDWGNIRIGLGKIGVLPESLRNNAQAQCALCDLVFNQSAERFSANDSHAIVTYLQKHREEGLLVNQTKTSLSPDSVSADLDELAKGLPNITEEKVSTLIATGVDEPLPELIVNLPPTPSVQSLMAQMRHDEQLGGLMTLARTVLATVQIPRKLADPDTLPLGGVSDISNRGPLDKLLLSELANDDDLLATRIALNEALYLRREAPPRDSNDQRILILDTGIRLWGMPRLLACATGLAVASASEKSYKLESWRPRESSLTPVDLATREGLLEHLASLETSPHPGSALAAVEGLMENPDEAGEVVLVTHRNSLNDPDFRRMVADSGLSLLYVLAVHQDGSVELHLLTQQGSKQLSCTTVDNTLLVLAYDGLFKDTSSLPPDALLLHKPSPAHSSSPLILSLTPFPLLLAPKAKPHKIVYAPDHGILALGSDRRIQYQENSDRGATQLSDDFPKGQVLAMLPTAEGLVHIPVKYEFSLHLVTCNLVTGNTIRYEIDEKVIFPSEFSLSGKHLLVANRSWIKAFATDGSGLTDTLQKQESMYWRGSRFYVDNQGLWFEALVVNEKIILKPISHMAEPPRKTILKMFDQYGIEGPLALAPSLETESPKEKEKSYDILDSTGKTLGQVSITVPTKSCSLIFSPNGRHCWYHPTEQGMRTFGLSDYRSQKWGASPIHEPEVTNALNHERSHYLTKLLLAGVTKSGHLYVCNRKGTQYYHFKLNPGNGRLVFSIIPNNPAPSSDLDAQNVAKFLPLLTSKKTSQVTHSGRWPDGSEVYLDHRGLLHLISSKPELPQITLTLIQGECAAWTSDGRSCGPDYHFPPGRRIRDDKKIADLLTQFGSSLPKRSFLP